MWRARTNQLTTFACQRRLETSCLVWATIDFVRNRTRCVLPRSPLSLGSCNVSALPELFASARSPAVFVERLASQKRTFATPRTYGTQFFV
jgi:hypothetical protein